VVRSVVSNRVLSFEDEQKRRGAYARSDRGLRVVDIARITGSVGRASVLNRLFRYRRGMAPPGTATRLGRLRRLFDSGGVPPLALYQIDEDFFVVDGHHRVALAHERGQAEVDATVVEYLPDRRDPANSLYYERRAFVRATGLREVRASELGRYATLLGRIRDHRHELVREHAARRESLVLPFLALTERPDLRAAARDWYDREYLPVMEILAGEGSSGRFPGSAPGDLYGHVSDHRWYMSERRGWDVGIDTALGDFLHRNPPRPGAAALLDPIVALGSELLDGAPRAGTSPIRRLLADVRIALAVGVLALPVAFLRGLRPGAYRFARPGPADAPPSGRPAA
jgi:hypothetical protein